jgi:RHS repeat-associated protein
VNFKYDPFGSRIQKNGTNYVYDGVGVIEEVDSSENLLAKYSQGPGIDEPLSELRSGTISYYEQDGLGSVTSLSNIGGVLANTYIFDSFGNATNSTGSITNPYQYTGRDYDPETGLLYYRARYYDPTTGRFLTEDPMGVGGVASYGYAAGNPTNLTDPSGLCPPSMCDDLLKKIVHLRNVLAAKFSEYLKPIYNLRLFGPMSRDSHIKAIEKYQEALRKRLDRYDDMNCPDPPPTDSWRWATQPPPKLSPSPPGLLPLPLSITPPPEPTTHWWNARWPVIDDAAAWLRERLGELSYTIKHGPPNGPVPFGPVSNPAANPLNW